MSLHGRVSFTREAPSSLAKAHFWQFCPLAKWKFSFSWPHRGGQLIHRGFSLATCSTTCLHISRGRAMENGQPRLPNNLQSVLDKKISETAHPAVFSLICLSISRGCTLRSVQQQVPLQCALTIYGLICRPFLRGCAGSILQPCLDKKLAKGVPLAICNLICPPISRGCTLRNWLPMWLGNLQRPCTQKFAALSACPQAVSSTLRSQIWWECFYWLHHQNLWPCLLANLCIQNFEAMSGRQICKGCAIRNLQLHQPAILQRLCLEICRGFATIKSQLHQAANSRNVSLRVYIHIQLEISRGHALSNSWPCLPAHFQRLCPRKLPLQCAGKFPLGLPLTICGLIGSLIFEAAPSGVCSHIQLKNLQRLCHWQLTASSATAHQCPVAVAGPRKQVCYQQFAASSAFPCQESMKSGNGHLCCLQIPKGMHSVSNASQPHLLANLRGCALISSPRCLPWTFVDAVPQELTSSSCCQFPESTPSGCCRNIWLENVHKLCNHEMAVTASCSLTECVPSAICSLLFVLISSGQISTLHSISVWPLMATILFDEKWLLHVLGPLSTLQCFAKGGFLGKSSHNLSPQAFHSPAFLLHPTCAAVTFFLALTLSLLMMEQCHALPPMESNGCTVKGTMRWCCQTETHSQVSVVILFLLWCIFPQVEQKSHHMFLKSSIRWLCWNVTWTAWSCCREARLRFHCLERHLQILATTSFAPSMTFCLGEMTSEECEWPFRSMTEVRSSARSHYVGCRND